MPADELIDVVDEALNPLGAAPKAVAHREGLWHYSIQCWIYRVDDASGEPYLFFQRRSPDKDLFPGYLDISAAGHYRSGERPEDGVREISEELGLDVSFGDLLDLGIRTEAVKTGTILNREFCRVYLLRTDLAPAEFTPDGDEVHGLVEIAVSDGLALFAGERDEALVTGIELIPGTAPGATSGGWRPIATMVIRDDFAPRVDPYYLKMCLLTRLAARGERYLAV